MMKSRNPYRRASYLGSAREPRRLPADHGREAAFIGRSNAGKSSVINAVADNRRLARISKTPGRTRQLNFFEVTPSVRLVDLPGYGFARVSAELRRQWADLIGKYLDTRRSLRGVVLVADVRRTMGEAEHQVVNWCGAAGLDLHLVLNKADKVSFGAGRAALAQARKELDGCGAQLFSAASGTGVDELRAVLDAWLFGGR